MPSRIGWYNQDAFCELKRRLLEVSQDGQRIAVTHTIRAPLARELLEMRAATGNANSPASSCMLLSFSRGPYQEVCAAQAIRTLLAAEFPRLKHVETSTLHRGVAGARHSFLPCPPDQNKLEVLAQVWHCVEFFVIVTYTCSETPYLSARLRIPCPVCAIRLGYIGL